MTNVTKNEAQTKLSELNKELGLLTKQEAAALMNVSPWTVDRYVKNGKLKVKKMGDTKQAKCFFFKKDVLSLYSSDAN